MEDHVPLPGRLAAPIPDPPEGGDGPPGAAGGGAPAAPADDGALVLPGRLALPAPREPAAAAPLRFQQRSAELLAHARSALAVRRAEAQAEALQAQLRQATVALELAASLPGVASLVRSAQHRPRTAGRLSPLAARPEQFAALVLCAFFKHPPRQLGVCVRRLWAAAAHLVSLRQERSLRLLLANARICGRFHRGQVSLRVFSYSHEWDETRAYFFMRAASTSKFAYRRSQSSSNVQTMVARGTARVFLHPAQTGAAAEAAEEWLVAPFVVPGTKAGELWPALQAGLPSLFRQWRAGAEGLLELDGAFDHALFLPIGDQASSNVVIQRRWGWVFESELSFAHPGLLYFPEVCQVHQHHRGKLQLRELRFHTSRHYSLSSLYRLESVQRHAIATVEHAVSSSFARVLHEEPPESRHLLRAFFQVVHKLDSAVHDRKGGKSRRWHDIADFLAVANGDPLSGRAVHYCTRSSASESGPGRWCCGSDAEACEKYTIRLVSLVLGSVDPLPSESRWTHLLPAMGKTLTRRVLLNVGARCFAQVTLGPEHEHATLDGEEAARAEFYVKMNGIRSQRAKQYYEDDLSMFRLGVLFAIVDAADELLYLMLGGADRSAPPAKVTAFLDKDTSAVARVQARFVSMLDGAGWQSLKRCLALRRSAFPWAFGWGGWGGAGVWRGLWLGGRVAVVAGRAGRSVRGGAGGRALRPWVCGWEWGWVAGGACLAPSFSLGGRGRLARWRAAAPALVHPRTPASTAAGPGVPEVGARAGALGEHRGRAQVRAQIWHMAIPAPSSLRRGVVRG